MIIVRGKGLMPSNGDDAERASEAGEVRLELRGTADEVAWAVVATTERGGGRIEGLEVGSPPGGGYRITTRADGSDDVGPVMVVFELSDQTGVGGVTRVRIVQSGFGAQADWDELFTGKHAPRTGASRPHELRVERSGPLPRLPGDREGLPLGWPPEDESGVAVPSPSGPWPERLPAPDLDLGRLHPGQRWPVWPRDRPTPASDEPRDGRAAWRRARPDLVWALEEACARLLAKHVSAPTSTRAAGGQ